MSILWYIGCMTTNLEPYDRMYSDGLAVQVRPLRRIRAIPTRDPFTRKPRLFIYRAESVTDPDGNYIAWSNSYETLD